MSATGKYGRGCGETRDRENLLDPWLDRVLWEYGVTGVGANTSESDTNTHTTAEASYGLAESCEG